MRGRTAWRVVCSWDLLLVVGFTNHRGNTWSPRMAGVLPGRGSGAASASASPPLLGGDGQLQRQVPRARGDLSCAARAGDREDLDAAVLVGEPLDAARQPQV